MPIRDERDTDASDAQRRKELRPPPEKSLAIQVQTEAVKYSQVLVDEKIQGEQVAFQPKITVSEYPEDTQRHKGADNVEEILNTDPVKMVQPVKTPPVETTTIPAWLKKQLGVPSITSSTKDVIPRARAYDFTKKKWLGSPPPAFSPPVAKTGKPLPAFYPVAVTKKTVKHTPAFSPPGLVRTVKHTPVKGLNFIDKFFNWLNALLK